MGHLQSTSAISAVLIVVPAHTHDQAGQSDPHIGQSHNSVSGLALAACRTGFRHLSSAQGRMLKGTWVEVVQAIEDV